MMLKKLRLLIITVCIALAAGDVSHVVGNPEQYAKILSQNYDADVEGQYAWSFDTENGISVKTSGVLNNPQSENAAQVSQGNVQYTAPDGQVVQLEYVADENGFQPRGSHIPTPPPIPPEIIKALEYLRAHPPAPEIK